MLRTADTIAPTDILIEDPLMEPLFVTKAQSGGYAVYERVPKGKSDKLYIRTVGYFSNFDSCLKRISKELIHHADKTKFSSIKEYIELNSALEKKMSTLTGL